MSWRAITEADLLLRLSGSELDALREAALGDGQADPIQGAIDQVTELARGYIAANGGVTLGAAGTLPERLIAPCVDILVVDVSGRAAGTLSDPNETRRDAYRAAIRLLEQVAAGNYSIDDPDDGAEQSASPSISEKTRTHDRTSQDGI